MRRTLFVACAVAVSLTFTAAVHGQPPMGGAPQQNPAKAPGTILKGKAPVSKEVLKVTLPKPKEADLVNGIHLLVVEDHRAPIVNFTLVIDGAGGYYDPADVPGLAGFTASLMREGTATKTSEQLSEQLDRLAASVNVAAGISSVFATVNGSGLSDNVDQVLSAMADVLTHPSFPQAEIDRFKTRTRAGLMNTRTQPGFLAQERFAKAVFGDHPSAKVIATPAALDALSRDKLVEFHKAHYVPDHAVMAVAGDITLEQAKQKLDAVFADWKKSGAPLSAATNPPPVGPTTISLIARDKSVQTTLFVGTQAIDRTSPDYEALTVANRILGSTPNGRLFEHLREQKGYTYGAGSSFSAGRLVGSWSATTDVRSEVTEPALTDLIDEIKQMRDTPVPADELGNAKRAIVAGFARSLESANTVLNDYIDVYVYKLPKDYWDTYPSRIEAIGAADIQRVAQKYWAADRLHIVAVGEQPKVEPALKKLGPVQVFDTEGKPLAKGSGQ